MRTDSNDISRGWTTIPSNSDTNYTTTNEQSSPPAYSPTAANYFATPTYDAETSPVLTAAASRRMKCSDSRYAFPSPLPSYIEMQDLGAGAGAGAGAVSPASGASSVLPGPATQPKKQHGALCRFAWMVLKILLFAAGAAAALGALYGIWRLIYWLAYKI